MARVTSLSKIGKRLDTGLRRKGVNPIDVMNALGGRAIQTWYRWIKGEQEGGWKDIAQAGLFLGISPNELMLEDEQEALQPDVFTEDDRVQIESLRTMLAELTRMVGPNAPKRPVALLVEHVDSMLKLLRSQANNTNSRSYDLGAVAPTRGRAKAAEGSAPYSKRKRAE